MGRKVVFLADDRRIVQWTTGSRLLLAEFVRRGDRCVVRVSSLGET